MFKKILVLLLTLSVIMPCIFTVPKTSAYNSPERVLLGDIDDNKELDIYDITRLRAHIIGMKELVEEDFEISDVNLDEFVDIIDLVKIRNAVVNQTIIHDIREVAVERRKEIITEYLSDNIDSYVFDEEYIDGGYYVSCYKTIDGVKTSDAVYLMIDGAERVWIESVENKGKFDDLQKSDIETVIQEQGCWDDTADSISYRLDITDGGELIIIVESTTEGEWNTCDEEPEKITETSVIVDGKVVIKNMNAYEYYDSVYCEEEENDIRKEAFEFINEHTEPYFVLFSVFNGYFTDKIIDTGEEILCANYSMWYQCDWNDEVTIGDGTMVIYRDKVTYELESMWYDDLCFLNNIQTVGNLKKKTKYFIEDELVGAYYEDLTFEGYRTEVIPGTDEIVYIAEYSAITGSCGTEDCEAPFYSTFDFAVIKEEGEFNVNTVWHEKAMWYDDYLEKYAQ